MSLKPPPIGSQDSLPYLTAEEIRDSKKELRESFRGKIDPLHTNPRLTSLIQRYLPAAGNILDAGCANGAMLRLLHEWGYQNTYGADIESFLSDGEPSREFKKFDFNYEKFPWPDGAFDGVLSIEVIEHLENPFHFLRECARILKPAAYLILTTPNLNHIWNKLSFFRKGEFYRFLPENNHIMPFSDPILKKGVLRFFELKETAYDKGEFPYRWLDKFRYSANSWFGRTVMYVLEKR